ncbi:hypothetical protein [Cohnella caldifontis]|uniref:hypothetical protein n=1 Tax=Cohnella caldifontis TaxID=3027471 RepID=UPI0023EBAD59|nr:hypothetical protein [Cohnella sp. YIM B05605]
MRKIPGMILLVWIGLLFLPAAVSAQNVFGHHGALVPENQTVRDVVAIGGDADIAGTVEGSVVVFNGDLRIRSTAHVHGFVLLVGGQLRQDTGAELDDDILTISFDNATLNSLLIGGGMVAGIAALQLAGTLLMVLVPLLIRSLASRKAAAFTDRYRTASWGRLLLIGLLAGVILFAVCLLLLFTVVGIPLILVIAALALASMAAGLTVMSQLLGEQIQGMFGRAEWTQTAAGAFLLAASTNIPVIGGILLIVLAAISLGIAVTWGAGLRKRKKRNG